MRISSLTRYLVFFLIISFLFSKDIGFEFEYKKKIQNFEATQAYDCTEFLNMNNENEDENEDEVQNKDRENHKRLLSDHVEDSQEETKEKKPKLETPNVMNEEKKDDDVVTPKKENNIIKDQLVCTICDELMHDCVSLQPCLHSYCAGKSII